MQALIIVNNQFFIVNKMVIYSNALTFDQDRCGWKL